MPELPEVETTLLGIQPYILNQTITAIHVRQHRLRYPVPEDIATRVTQQNIHRLSRRGKYLLFHTTMGVLLCHLGMSGRLRILDKYHPPGKHDHVDIAFANQYVLRYTDPRRFGCWLWVNDGQLVDHPLLKKLGIEPFDASFNGQYLWERAQRKTVATKLFIMDNHIVVGVGNIYATEALFMAGIHPQTPVHTLSLAKLSLLATSIQVLLKKAIAVGGTSLKDFLGASGKPGYFRMHLQAYGRAGAACLQCGEILQKCVMGQRTSTYCACCQKI